MRSNIQQIYDRNPHDKKGITDFFDQQLSLLKSRGHDKVASLLVTLLDNYTATTRVDRNNRAQAIFEVFGSEHLLDGLDQPQVVKKKQWAPSA